MKNTLDKSKIIDAKNTFSKFRSEGFRPSQLDIIKRAYESEKKIVVICAPTGFGKSLTNMIVGRLHNRFCYLCSSKQLQEQLRHDFPEVKVMKGRNNFPCNLVHGRSAADCTHTESTPCQYKGKRCSTSCNYEVQKCEVAQYPYQVLNYAYFLYEANYVGTFSEYPVMICDEADTLDGLLTSFISLDISNKQIYELHLDPPRYVTSTAKDGLSSWSDWALYTRDIIKKQTLALERELEYTSDDDIQTATIRKHKTLTNLSAKLDIFISTVDANWLFSDTSSSSYSGSGWSFKPTWLQESLSTPFFFRHAEKFILTSATFPPADVLAMTLGVSPGDIDYWEVTTAFDPAHRPVYLDPVGDLSYKTIDHDLPKVIDRISEILLKYPNQHGIIHTSSWKVARAVMALKDPRLISHENGVDKTAIMQDFYNIENSVLVSPSSVRGLDLPDDECRFSIIAKAPYLSIADKMINARTYSSTLGKKWYASQCAQQIVQACGRGVRHKDDWCENYVLDSQAFKLITGRQSLFPKYFLDAVEII